jgi:hypothetical protein
MSASAQHRSGGMPSSSSDGFLQRLVDAAISIEQQNHELLDGRLALVEREYVQKKRTAGDREQLPAGRCRCRQIKTT